VTGDAPRTIRERLAVRWRMFRARPIRHARLTVLEFVRRARGASLQRRRIRLALSGKQIPAHLRDVARSRTRALKRYVPTPWNGSIVLIRSRSWARKGPTDPMLGWGKLALGGIDDHDVPGHHLNFIKGEHAGDVARILRDAMDRAIESRRDSGDGLPRGTDPRLSDFET